MSLEMFLQTVFQISIAAIFTALCCAGVVVCVYYTWKAADNLIRKREKHIGWIEKVTAFKPRERPAISMVKAERKAKA